MGLRSSNTKDRVVMPYDVIMGMVRDAKLEAMRSQVQREMKKRKETGTVQYLATGLVR